MYEHIRDTKAAITGPCYVGADRDKLIAMVKEKMKPLVNYLGDKSFMVENKLTFIDFLMLELCEFAHWITLLTFYEENENVERYV